MNSPMTTFMVRLAIAILGLAGYWYWYQTVVDRSAAVITLEQQVALRQESASRAAAVQAVLADIENEEAVVRSYFVSEDRIAAFVDDLQARGRERGAQVKIMSVAVAPASEHAALAIALSIEGSFDQVSRTLGSIEYAPYDLVVTGAAYSRDLNGRWRADIKLLVGSTPGATALTTTKP